LNEFDAPVLGPAVFSVLAADRLIFAFGPHRHPVAGNASVGHIAHHGAGALLAQGQVVFLRTAIVAVPLNYDFEIGRLLQAVDVFVEGLTGIRSKVVFVKIKVSVAHGDHIAGGRIHGPAGCRDLGRLCRARAVLAHHAGPALLVGSAARDALAVVAALTRWTVFILGSLCFGRDLSFAAAVVAHRARPVLLDALIVAAAFLAGAVDTHFTLLGALLVIVTFRIVGLAASQRQAKSS
jgi:hypothetical protein